MTHMTSSYIHIVASLPLEQPSCGMSHGTTFAPADDTACSAHAGTAHSVPLPCGLLRCTSSCCACIAGHVLFVWSVDILCWSSCATVLTSGSCQRTHQRHTGMVLRQQSGCHSVLCMLGTALGLSLAYIRPGLFWKQGCNRHALPTQGLGSPSARPCATAAP